MLKRLLVVAVLSLCACQPEEGPAGPPGPAGPQGVQGPQGAQGESGVGLVSTVRCSSTESLVNGVSLTASYSRYLFLDGSVLASCDLADRYTSFASVNLWRVGSIGAAQGTCTLVYDVDIGASGTGGFWAFSHTPGRPTDAVARYIDSASPRNGTTLQMTCEQF